MRAFLVLLLALAECGYAQVPAYGQCKQINHKMIDLTNLGGGTGYTGATICATGFYCNSYNACK